MLGNTDCAYGFPLHTNTTWIPRKILGPAWVSSAQSLAKKGGWRRGL